MQVIHTERFLWELQDIFEFIAQDSLFYAQKFKDDLYAALETLQGDIARGFRKSFYVDDPAVHDFIFKGYVIPYEIDETTETVSLLGIFKHNIWRY